jgi:fumarylpyruvate hydrolase
MAEPAPAYVLAPPPRPAVPVRGGGLFPVRRIWCVGRNYAAHAREMGGDPAREPPFFFAKPADAVLCGGDMPYPPATAALHHEIELVAAITGGGADIPASRGLGQIGFYGVGLDMTRRDLQEAAKAARRPWDMAKGFDHAAPLSELVPATGVDPGRGRISLTVNGALRQSGDLADMIWPLGDIVAALSRLVRLAPGDLIFTGTPEGVGPVGRGDVLAGAIEGVGRLALRIV